MPIPFLNSIKLNKNQVEDFCVFNYSGDPTLSSGADFGYLWLNTSATPKVLKFWDGTNYRTLIDSTTISSSTAGTANDLSGGVAGSLPYQQAAGDTTFLGIGSSGYILTSTGSAPQWSASIPSTSVSGLAASATTDTTNASNISSGTLGLARLALATGQFYVGDGSNNPAATAKSSIPLSGFGNAAADINIGGFKITNSGTIGSGDADSTVATKGYVDSVAQGLDVKASCLVATTADITLASPGAVTIDGIYSATDFTAGTTRILVKDQSAPAENGIYIWQGPSSAMTRSADANTWDELVGAFTFVERGTANADSGWVCTVNAGGTLGSTAVTWVKFSQAGSYTAGNGIVQSGTSFNFAQSSAYTAGQIPFASSTTAIGFNANLHWDNANNRLGIGTATPAYPLSVNGRISYIGAIGEGADTTLSSSSTGLLHGNSSYWTEHRFYASGNEQHRIAQSGVFTWYDGAGGTRMTLNGTGLGVGVSPNTILHVRKDFAGYTTIKAENQHTIAAGTGISFTINDGGTDASWFRRHRDGTGNTDIGYNAALRFRGQVTATERTDMLIDSSGNVGIGTTTPAASLQVGARSSSAAANNSTILTAGGASASAGTTVAATFANTVAAAVGNEAQITFTPASNYSATGAIGTAITSTTNGESALKFYTYNDSIAGLTEKFRIASNGVCTWSNVVNAGTAMTLNGTGLGLGVTPSAWGAAAFKAIDINTRGAFAGTSGGAYVVYNAFYNASNQWIYKQSDTAAYYAAELGAHKWFTASSGTAGNAITFTQAMTLFSNGALSLGTASDALSQPGNVYLHGDSGSGKGATIAFGQAGAVIGCIGQLARIVGGGTSQDIFIQSQGTSNNVGINAYPSGAVIYFQTQGTERLRIKSTGQVNFVGLASDPAGAAGDVVYNSTSNRLKYHNGTAWVDSGTRKVSVVGGAGTGTYIDATHNFNTKTVSVTVLRTTDNVVVYTDVAMTNDNTVRVTFASSVTLADYTVTVIG